MSNRIYQCVSDADFANVNITIEGCAPTPGQAARFAFSHRGGTVSFTDSSTTDIKGSAQWALEFAKTGVNQTILAPLHENLDWPVTEALSREMNNSKRLKAYRKGNAVTVKGMWPLYSLDDLALLDNLSGYSSPFATNSNLLVYIMTENNMIWHTKTTFKGIPIWNFIVFDPTPVADDVVMIPFQFDIEYGWSRGLELSQATFDVLKLTV